MNLQAHEIFNKYAKEYQERFMDISIYHEALDIFCDALPTKNSNVLEVACGPGNITTYLLKKRPDLNILGTDLAPNMVELAKQNVPLAEFKIMDGRKIMELKQKFDGIVSGFFFPYLSQKEVENFIHDASSKLNKNGVLFISTMEDDHSKSGIQKGSKGDEIFMNYHEEKHLTDTLIKNNFKIINIQRKDAIASNGMKNIDLLITSQKQ